VKTILFAIAFFSASAVANAEPTGGRSIDPSWIGQQDSVLRAAAPDVAWRQTDPDQWVGPNFARWGDMSFDANVLAGPMGEIDFSHTEQVTTSAQCESAFLALVAALEPRFGPFQWDTRVLPNQEFLVHTNGGSTVMVSAWTEQPVQAAPPSRFDDPLVTGFGARTKRLIGQGDSGAELLLLGDRDGFGCELKVQLRMAPSR